MLPHVKIFLLLTELKNITMNNAAYSEYIHGHVYEYVHEIEKLKNICQTNNKYNEYIYKIDSIRWFSIVFSFFVFGIIMSTLNTDALFLSKKTFISLLTIVILIILLIIVDQNILIIQTIM